MVPLQTVLGNRLRELRLAAGMTQEQVAEGANLSLKHVGEMERGRGNPTFLSLVRLSEVFGVTLAALFNFEDERLTDDEIREEFSAMLREANPQHDADSLTKFSSQY